MSSRPNRIVRKALNFNSGRHRIPTCWSRTNDGGVSPVPHVEHVTGKKTTQTVKLYRRHRIYNKYIDPVHKHVGGVGGRGDRDEYKTPDRLLYVPSLFPSPSQKRYTRTITRRAAQAAGRCRWHRRRCAYALLLQRRVLYTHAHARNVR